MAHRPEPGFPFGSETGQRLTRPVARALGRWWIRYERSGAAVPPGPLVVAANHYSHVDPVVVSMTVGRAVRYLAVDELFGTSRFFDGLTHWMGAIPVSRRRAPLGAMRTALAELARGGTVGVFPEGVRVWVWGEARPKRGAAWLAHRAAVPLLPVALAGTDGVMGRGGHGIARSRVAAVICEPIGADTPPAAMMTEWERRVGEALRSTYARWDGEARSP